MTELAKWLVPIDPGWFTAIVSAALAAALLASFLWAHSMRVIPGPLTWGERSLVRRRFLVRLVVGVGTPVAASLVVGGLIALIAPMERPRMLALYSRTAPDLRPDELSCAASDDLKDGVFPIQGSPNEILDLGPIVDRILKNHINTFSGEFLRDPALEQAAERAVRRELLEERAFRDLRPGHAAPPPDADLRTSLRGVPPWFTESVELSVLDAAFRVRNATGAVVLPSLTIAAQRSWNTARVAFRGKGRHLIVCGPGAESHDLDLRDPAIESLSAARLSAGPAIELYAVINGTCAANPCATFVFSVQSRDAGANYIVGEPLTWVLSGDRRSRRISRIRLQGNLTSALEALQAGKELWITSGRARPVALEPSVRTTSLIVEAGPGREQWVKALRSLRIGPAQPDNRSAEAALVDELQSDGIAVPFIIDGTQNPTTPVAHLVLTTVGVAVSPDPALAHEVLRRLGGPNSSRATFRIEVSSPFGSETVFSPKDIPSHCPSFDFMHNQELKAIANRYNPFIWTGSASRDPATECAVMAAWDVTGNSRVAVVALADAAQVLDPASTSFDPATRMSMLRAICWGTQYVCYRGFPPAQMGDSDPFNDSDNVAGPMLTRNDVQASFAASQRPVSRAVIAACGVYSIVLVTILSFSLWRTSARRVGRRR